MAPDKNKIARDCFARGSQAMSKQQWDYAIEMFKQAALLVPDNVMFRQSLRGCEEKKYDGNKKGARMAGLKLTRIKGRIKAARMKDNWEAIDGAAEDGLVLNPWDAQLNADMAQSCAQRGFHNCAVFGFQKAVAVDPDNTEFLRELGLSLEETANYTDAIKCWEQIHKIEPLNSEARAKINQLEASSAMHKGGYEDAESTRDVQSEYDRDKFAKTQIPDAVQGPGVSLEQDLLRAVRKDPENKDNYLKLANIYQREKRVEEAIDAYQKALDASGGDPNIKEQLEDAELLLMRNNLELARQAFRSNPEDETAKRNTTDLAKELLRREIDVFSRRTARHQNDMRLKFELALRFMRVGKINDAIPLLQQATSDTRIQNDVLVALGRCFGAVDQKDLALRQFQKAIPNINPQDKPELLVKAHYQAGLLSEQLEQLEGAEAHFGEVIAIDYTYKDARQRLEQLQKRKGSGGAA